MAGSKTKHHQEGPIHLGKFDACAITTFQKPQHLGGPDSMLVDSHVTCAASAGPDLSGQRGCSCGGNYCWSINRQRRLGNRKLIVEFVTTMIQRGWSARMATRWLSHRPSCSIRNWSLHVSSLANNLSESLRAPSPVASSSPFTLFAR